MRELYIEAVNVCDPKSVAAILKSRGCPVVDPVILDLTTATSAQVKTLALWAVESGTKLVAYGVRDIGITVDLSNEWARDVVTRLMKWFLKC